TGLREHEIHRTDPPVFRYPRRSPHPTENRLTRISSSYDLGLGFLNHTGLSIVPTHSITETSVIAITVSDISNRCALRHVTGFPGLGLLGRPRGALDGRCIYPASMNRLPTKPGA